MSLTVSRKNAEKSADFQVGEQALGAYRASDNFAAGLAPVAATRDIDKIHSAFKDLHHSYQILNTTLTRDSYNRGNVKSNSNGVFISTELSVINNHEIAECIENLQWNIGLLKPGALTGSLGDWFMQRATALDYKRIGATDARKAEVLQWIEHDSQRLSALLDAATKVKEFQFYVDKDDRASAGAMLPQLMAACGRAIQYTQDESKKVGLIVFPLQATEAAVSGDWAAARSKARELEMVAVAGIKPENVQGALKYIDNLSKASFFGFDYDPEDRRWWSDIATGSLYIGGTIQSFWDTVWYLNRAIQADPKESAEYWDKAGLAAVGCAVSVGFDYLMYRYAKSKGYTGSPFNIPSVMNSFFGTGAIKATGEAAVKEIFKDGAVKLTPEQCIKMAKEPIALAPEQLKAIQNGGGMVARISKKARVLTDAELAARSQNLRALTSDINRDGWVLLENLFEPKALDPLLKHKFIEVLAINASIREPMGLLKGTVEGVKAPSVIVGKLKITSKTLQELEEYGLVRIGEDYLRGTEAEVISRLAKLAKENPDAVRNYFATAFSELEKIKAWEKAAKGIASTEAKRVFMEKAKQWAKAHSLFDESMPQALKTIKDAEGFKATFGASATAVSDITGAGVRKGFSTTTNMAGETARSMADALGKKPWYIKTVVATTVPFAAAGTAAVGATELGMKTTVSVLGAGGWLGEKTVRAVVDMAKTTIKSPAPYVAGKIAARLGQPGYMYELSKGSTTASGRSQPPVVVQSKQQTPAFGGEADQEVKPGGKQDTSSQQQAQGWGQMVSKLAPQAKSIAATIGADLQEAVLAKIGECRNSGYNCWQGNGTPEEQVLHDLGASPKIEDVQKLSYNK